MYFFIAPTFHHSFHLDMYSSSLFENMSRPGPTAAPGGRRDKTGSSCGLASPALAGCAYYFPGAPCWGFKAFSLAFSMALSTACCACLFHQPLHSSLSAASFLA
jgi:hypothetical protein